MPDGSTILMEGEDDNDKVDEWYKSNPDEKDRPKVQLPVDISIIDEKGNEEFITLTSDDEMKEIIGNCDKKREGKERCVKLLMPYTYNMPDGSLITINNEDDYKNIKCEKLFLKRLISSISVENNEICLLIIVKYLLI